MSIYVYTSIALNYLGKARVLSTTLKRIHPDWKFCIVICEPIDAETRSTILRHDDIDEVITYDQFIITDGFQRPLSQVEMQQWCFKHSIVEFCTAVKGSALCYLLNKPDCEAAFYFDPDMAIFDSLTQLTDYFDQGKSILLTPHLIETEQTREAIWDNEISVLRHGIYNLGFLGVKNDINGKKLAQWWKDRLDMYCYADIPNGVFTDQSWFDMVPATFEGVQILRKPQYNVATWNLTHRFIDGADVHHLYVNKDYKLCFYHFSGFDSGAQLAMLQKYAKAMPKLFLLRDWYINQCKMLDDPSLSNRKWPFNYYSNGEKILNEQRTIYRNRSDLQSKFPDPFDASHPLYTWVQDNQLSIDLSSNTSCHCKREITALLNSHSWKLTKPLRAITSFFRNFKHA